MSYYSPPMPMPMRKRYAASAAKRPCVLPPAPYAPAHKMEKMIRTVKKVSGDHCPGSKRRKDQGAVELVACILMVEMRRVFRRDHQSDKIPNPK